MTTVGKILVVLHLVLSVMFMAFAGAVVTAQNNWRDAEKKRSAEVAAANVKIKDIQAQNEMERADSASKIAQLTSENQKFLGQNTALAAQVLSLDSDNKQLRKDVDQQRDQAALTSAEAVERKKEADLQREKNGELFSTREDLVKRLNETEDKRFSLELQLQQVSDKYEALMADFKTMKSFLASKDLTTDPKEMVAMTAPPPPVDGVVMDVRKADRGSRELVEISIGSDDGLVVGHKLTVFRGGKYLGVIRLTLVESDRAVGYVVTKDKNAKVAVGDSITTRF